LIVVTGWEIACPATLRLAPFNHLRAASGLTTSAFVRYHLLKEKVPLKARDISPEGSGCYLAREL